MHTIKYRPNYMSREMVVRFFGEWRRVRSTAASVYHVQDKKEDTAPHTIVERYFLMSYASPVIYAVIAIDYEMGYKKLHLFVNEDVWRCSNTTIHHVSSFLNELAQAHGLESLNYYELKRTMQTKSCKDGFVTEMFPYMQMATDGYRYDVLVSPCDDETVCNLFEGTPTVTMEYVG